MSGNIYFKPVMSGTSQVNIKGIAALMNMQHNLPQISQTMIPQLADRQNWAVGDVRADTIVAKPMMADYATFKTGELTARVLEADPTMSGNTQFKVAGITGVKGGNMMLGGKLADSANVNIGSISAIILI